MGERTYQIDLTTTATADVEVKVPAEIVERGESEIDA